MLIALDDLAGLAQACAVLGSGGGGDPEPALDVATVALRRGGPVEVVTPDQLDPQGLVLPWLYVGAPGVLQEKLWSGQEPAVLAAELVAQHGVPVVAIMPIEIGGQNGVFPVAWASLLGLPLVDADGMGRAFPLVTQTKMNVLGVAAGPIVVTDERANVVVVRPSTNAWAETLVRSAAGSLGGRVATAAYAVPAGELGRVAIRGSVSRALRLGRVVDSGPADPVEAIRAELGAVLVASGRVTEVERHYEQARVRGAAVVTDADGRGVTRVEFQDEYLAVLRDGRLRAVTPDVVAVLDSGTGRAISTERVRYGQRVSVVVFGCDPVWRTSRGLELVGPGAYGLGLSYAPVEELVAGA